MGKTDRTLNVQTPGAAQAPAEPEPLSLQGEPEPTSAAPADLPPDLQAIVAAEVTKALGKQRKADAAQAKAGPATTPYAEAEAQQQALPPHERKAVLTDAGWYCPPGMGMPPPGAKSIG